MTRYGTKREESQKLNEVVEVIREGMFGDPAIYRPLIDTLQSDYYLITHDFDSYLDAIKRADEMFVKDNKQWTRDCIRSTASMGHFSSDRAIEEYARDIWNIHPLSLPDPSRGASNGNACVE